MSIAGRLAGLRNGPAFIAHQRHRAPHPATQTEIENGFTEDGLESLGQGRFRHTDRSRQLGNCRGRRQLLHQNVARHVQALQFTLGVFLRRCTRQRTEALDGAAQQFQGQCFRVNQAERAGKPFSALPIETLQKFSSLFGLDFYDALKLESALAGPDVEGGTAPARVRDAISAAKERLAALEKKS